MKKLALGLFASLALVGTVATVSMASSDAVPLANCLQVITPAVNELTGECREFPNSCIPAGWKKVPSCANAE